MCWIVLIYVDLMFLEMEILAHKEYRELKVSREHKVDRVLKGYKEHRELRDSRVFKEHRVYKGFKVFKVL